MHIYIYNYIKIYTPSPHQTLQATGRIFFGPDTRPAPTPLIQRDEKVVLRCCEWKFGIPKMRWKS